MNTQESRPPSGPGPDAAPGGAGRPGEPAAEFFDRIRAFGVARPDEHRWAAGVCAGLARRWGLDPLLVRGLFVVGGLVTGIGLGVYGLLWLFLPHPDGRIHAQQVLRGTVTGGFVGSVLFVLIDFPLSSHWAFGGGWGLHPFGGLAFLAVIGLGVWWLVNRNKPGGPGGGFGGPGRAPGPDTPGHGAAAPSGTDFPGTASSSPAYGTPEPGPAGYGPGGYSPGGYGPTGYGPTDSYTPGGHSHSHGGHGPATVTSPLLKAPKVDLLRPLHSLTLTTLGAAMLAAGGIVVADRVGGGIRTAPVVAVAVALGVVALGIIVSGALGRRAGGLAPIAVLLAIAAANGAVWHDAAGGVDGRRTWRPPAAPASPYQLGAGRAVLDLTDPALAMTATGASPVTVTASLGAGELVVVVPPGTAVEVDASVGLGNVTDDVDRAGAVDRDGAGLNETVRHGTGTPAVVVEAKIGVGRIWIVRQGTKVDQ